MKFPKSAAALLAVVVLGVTTTGVAVATTASEPAKAYGLCISKANGAVRVLERTNLPKSRYGKCKSTEVKVTVPSIDGLPKPPTTLVFKRSAGTETCKRDSSSTASTAIYACTLATPSPSVSPSPTS